MPTLGELLRTTMAIGGSDLHLTAGAPPMARVHGALRCLDGYPELSVDEAKGLIYSQLTDRHRALHEDGHDVDFSFAVAGLARCRGNVFRQRGAVAAVYRLVPDQIRTFEDLGLPAVVHRLTEHPHGLVLVTGPTGSGKSTTLATMIDTVNIERRGHILTVEDPIEFVHTHKNCIVNQREIHTDAPSFGIALRAALREDPDVVLIGEVRDLETVEVALRIAETGHLTLATLHTGSAVQTLNRVIHMFPAGQQDQARQQLAMVLEGVVCQALVPTADGNGRVVAIEVLVATPGIRNLIREGKVQQVYSAMQVGQERAGMQTMNQALAALYRRRQITLEAAMAHSPNRPELQEMVTKASDGAPAGSTRADRWNTRV